MSNWRCNTIPTHHDQVREREMKPSDTFILSCHLQIPSLTAEVEAFSRDTHLRHCQQHHHVQPPCSIYRERADRIIPVIPIPLISQNRHLRATINTNRETHTQPIFLICLVRIHNDLSNEIDAMIHVNSVAKSSRIVPI